MFFLHYGHVCVRTANTSCTDNIVFISVMENDVVNSDWFMQVWYVWCSTSAL